MRLTRVVLGILLAALAGAPAGASAPPVMPIAHRGGADLWPENTMSAFRNAQAMFEDRGAAGWLELDTQFSSDGVLVVMHDATLDRTTDCSGPVVEKTAAELAACDAADSFEGWPTAEPVPTLEQIFTEGAASGWRLVVEIKDIPGEPGFDLDCTELADALASLVDATGFDTDRLIVQSFWPLCLERLEGTAPDIATLLLTSSSTLNQVVDALTGTELPVPLGFTLLENAVFATARGYEVSAPDFTAPDMSTAAVAAAHALGRRVVVWTPDLPSDFERLLSFGLDGIITDRPDLLLDALGFYGP